MSSGPSADVWGDRPAKRRKRSSAACGWKAILIYFGIAAGRAQSPGRVRTVPQKEEPLVSKYRGSTGPRVIPRRKPQAGKVIKNSYGFRGSSLFAIFPVEVLGNGLRGDSRLALHHVDAHQVALLHQAPHALHGERNEPRGLIVAVQQFLQFDSGHRAPIASMVVFGPLHAAEEPLSFAACRSMPFSAQITRFASSSVRISFPRVGDFALRIKASSLSLVQPSFASSVLMSAQVCASAIRSSFDPNPARPAVP